MTHQQHPRRTRKIVLIAVGALVALTAVMAIAGALVPEEYAGETKEAAPAATSAPPSSAPAVQPAAPTPAVRPQPTAQQIADRLAGLYPLPNPRDNTNSCAPQCRQLITTDAVSIYEWATEGQARRFADGRDDVRQVGRYVLSWAGEEQALTSAEARADMVAELRRMLR